jgi:hypothetical protein
MESDYDLLELSDDGPIVIPLGRPRTPTSIRDLIGSDGEDERLESAIHRFSYSGKPPSYAEDGRGHMKREANRERRRKGRRVLTVDDRGHLFTQFHALRREIVSMKSAIATLMSLHSPESSVLPDAATTATTYTEYGAQMRVLSPPSVVATAGCGSESISGTRYTAECAVAGCGYTSERVWNHTRHIEKVHSADKHATAELLSELRRCSSLSCSAAKGMNDGNNRLEEKTPMALEARALLPTETRDAGNHESGPSAALARLGTAEETFARAATSRRKPARLFTPVVSRLHVPPSCPQNVSVAELVQSGRKRKRGEEEEEEEEKEMGRRRTRDGFGGSAV